MRTKEELETYLVSYVEEMAFGEDDPAAVLDRYHAPELEWRNDGRLLERDGLIAHARPARRNVIACRVEVHDALVDGDRIAARYTLHAELAKGSVSTEIHMFGQVGADGRISRIDQLTRTPAAS